VKGIGRDERQSAGDGRRCGNYGFESVLSLQQAPLA
jgi:hypothetical protein